MTYLCWKEFVIVWKHLYSCFYTGIFSLKSNVTFHRDGSLYFFMYDVAPKIMRMLHARQRTLSRAIIDLFTFFLTVMVLCIMNSTPQTCQSAVIHRFAMATTWKCPPETSWESWNGVWLVYHDNVSTYTALSVQ